MTIDPADLQHHPPFSDSESEKYVGAYTLSIVGGRWYLHQEGPKGGRYDTSGTYAVDGGMITFTDRYDLRCFGTSRTGRWTLDAMELSFSGISSSTTPTCAPQGLNDAIRQAVFATHPWQPVNHHALGG